MKPLLSLAAGLSAVATRPIIAISAAITGSIAGYGFNDFVNRPALAPPQVTRFQVVTSEWVDGNRYSIIRDTATGKTFLRSNFPLYNYSDAQISNPESR